MSWARDFAMILKSLFLFILSKSYILLVLFNVTKSFQLLKDKILAISLSICFKINLEYVLFYFFRLFILYWNIASWLRIHPQCGRPGFDPWVGKIPWRREKLPFPVFLPGEFHEVYSPWGPKESDTSEWLSL